MEAVLAHCTRALALALALGVGIAEASAAVPADAGPSSTEIGEAKKVLAANGYSDIAVLPSHDRLVTASAMRDGKKSVLDVDPMTGIILPHVEMPPIPAELAPVTGVPGKPR